MKEERILAWIDALEWVKNHFCMSEINFLVRKEIDKKIKELKSKL